jgi:hypothetical protein
MFTFILSFFHPHFLKYHPFFKTPSQKEALLKYSYKKIESKSNKAY